MYRLIMVLLNTVLTSRKYLNVKT